MEKKIKLYIATKMRGLTREKIVSKLDFIARYCGYEPANVTYVNLLSEEDAAGCSHPVEMFAHSINMLPRADKVIIEKFELARGVSCEEYVCDKYRIPYTKIFLPEPDPNMGCCAE